MAVEAAGTVDGLSGFLVILVLLALAVVSVAKPPRWPSAFLVATLVGMVNLQSGGGLLVRLAWAGAAIALRRGSPT